jgi:hypothetical protein
MCEVVQELALVGNAGLLRAPRPSDPGVTVMAKLRPHQERYGIICFGRNDLVQHARSSDLVRHTISDLCYRPSDPGVTVMAILRPHQERYTPLILTE